MSIFPNLPLLDSLVSEQRRTPEIERASLVCLQHLTKTTGSLIEALIDFGFVPGNIHILGKLYSTDTEVQQQLRTLQVNVYTNRTTFRWGDYSNTLGHDVANMWNQAILAGAFNRIDKIIVLDDGGGAIAAVPSSLTQSKTIIGIEQTMSGISLNRTQRPLITYIGVGSSATKLLIEPRIIREGLLNSVAQTSYLGSGAAGIVGYGHIGRAVGEGLQAAGVDVFVYDQHLQSTASNRVVVCSTLSDLYRESDIIWGCTGSDHLSEHQWINYIREDKVLISCSSKDTEYRTILQALNGMPETIPISRLSDVLVKTASNSISILYGGFPVNFRMSSEVEPADDIQITRALLYLAVVQATLLSDEAQPGSEIGLDARSQLRTVTRWFEMYPQRRWWYQQKVIDLFKDMSAISGYQAAVRLPRFPD